MPLRFLDGFTDPQAVKEATEQYLIFYSSIVDGKLWCPDCRDVESLINQTFSAAAGPSALIVYVGNRSE
ncbi:hypothetical protein DXG01_009726 [Tephrocybe rancida]|nr:hypothetical protein DXG01_009726 [Tephrocybe rancida]